MAGELEYNKTAGSNAAINGIAIQGSSSIKYGNDAIQQLMADRAAAITRIVDKVAGTYTALGTDFNQMWRATGAVTVNLTAAATLTDGWAFWVKANGGAVTVDPNGAELINGASTLVVRDGCTALVICTGSAFHASVIGDVAAVGVAAGQVLTSNGTISAFEEPDLKFLTGGNFSGAQNDIVLTSYIAAGYTRFRLHWREWQPVTSGSQLLLLVSANGGSSFVASGYAGQALFAQGSAPTVASAGSGSNSAFNVVMGTTSGAGGFAAGHVDVDVLANYVSVRSYTHTVTTTPAHAVYLLTGHVAVTGANAIRLAPSAGNHNIGQFTLYGLRNS